MRSGAGLTLHWRLQLVSMKADMTGTAFIVGANCAANSLQKTAAWRRDEWEAASGTFTVAVSCGR